MGGWPIVNVEGGQTGEFWKVSEAEKDFPLESRPTVDQEGHLPIGKSLLIQPAYGWILGQNSEPNASISVSL